MFAIGRNEMCVCVCKCVSVHCGNLHESRIANAKSREGERERDEIRVVKNERKS